MRYLQRLALCTLLAAGIACSDDPEPADGGVGMDASVSPDAPPGQPDAPSTPDTGPGPMDAAVDGGMGPADTGPNPGMLFSDFVKNLINTQTNATSSPVALPAEGTLTDTEDQAEYQVLFP